MQSHQNQSYPNYAWRAYGSKASERGRFLIITFTSNCVYEEKIKILFMTYRDFPDIAARGFLHIDFIGQKFICYLLKKTGILMMYRLEKSNSPDIPTVGKSSSIPAKDAINISVSFKIQYFFIKFVSKLKCK